MLLLDNQEVLRLITQGEGEKVDFKHCITSKTKIARAIAAFANHLGGVLLIGIKDNGKPAKINCEEEIYMLEAAVEMCKPKIDFQVNEVEVDGKNILAVNIEAGKARPYYCQEEDGSWMVYVRVKDSNVLANWVWIELAKQKHAATDVYFEFKDKEEEVLKYLANRHLTTQRILAEELKYNFRKTGQILVKLVSMGLVLMEMRKDGTFFTINS